jgi:hypothetical protein
MFNCAYPVLELRAFRHRGARLRSDDRLPAFLQRGLSGIRVRSDGAAEAGCWITSF